MTTSTGNVIMENLITFKPSFKTFLIEILKSYSRTDYFVDVGANCGSSLIEVYGNNPEINYLGFEPNHNSFRFLSKIAKLNQIIASL